MVAAFAVHLIMVAVFAFLWAKDPGARHMRLWALSWAVGALRYLQASLGHALDFPEAANRVAYATLLVSGLLFMAGSYRLVKRSLPRPWIWVAVATACWIAATSACAALGRSVPFFIETLPTFAFVGVVDAWTGVVLIRSRHLGSSRWVLGVALLVWGAHRLDYPFLRPVAWFAPWGFGLASLLGVVVAVGMLLLYFERAWAETRGSEARFRSLFENASEGLFGIDGKGSILAANPSLARMFAVDSPDELVGQKIADLLRLFDGIADTADATAPPPRDSVDPGGFLREGGIEDREVRFRDRRGNEHVARLTLRPLEGTKELRYEGSLFDLTHERAVQEQLARAHRLEALGRLAGGVAHDFNNMLTAILAGAQLARLRLERGQAAYEDLQAIEDAASRAAEFTGQLLAFSRDQRAPQPERPLELSAVVARAAALLERLLGEDIRLELDLSSEPLWVRASPANLERVVMNLAVNARDALPRGGRLRIATRRAGDRAALLTVSDDGQGIPPELQDKVFDPFFTTKAPGKGTGLGLSTAYALARSWGGEVRLESAPGKGTTVEVRLPAAEPPPEAALAPKTAAPKGEGALLLIEDDPVVRRATASLLESLGYRVLPAADGDAAVAVARDAPSSLLAAVCDVRMPGASGPEVVRRLRRSLPELPVLFVSGFAGHETAAETLADLPRARFLAKPFGREQLGAALRDLLRDGAQAARPAGSAAIPSPSPPSPPPPAAPSPSPE